MLWSFNAWQEGNAQMYVKKCTAKKKNNSRVINSKYYIIKLKLCIVNAAYQYGC